jgi:hypothetical protein
MFAIRIGAVGRMIDGSVPNHAVPSKGTTRRSLSERISNSSRVTPEVGRVPSPSEDGMNG